MPQQTKSLPNVLTDVYIRLLKDQFDQITTPTDWNLWSLLFFVPITVLLITCHILNTKHPEKNLVSRLGSTKNIIYETRDKKIIRGGTDIGETYRLWSVGLVHASWAHLWTNMILLWTAAFFFVMCPTLMDGYHTSQLYFLYFISQVGSSVVSLSQDTSTYNKPRGASVGASGAIWGLWGAIFQRFFQQVVVRSSYPIPLHMVFLLILFGMWYGIFQTNYDNYAHVGGFITGFFADMMFFSKLDSSNDHDKFMLLLLILIIIVFYIVIPLTKPATVLFQPVYRQPPPQQHVYSSTTSTSSPSPLR